MASKTDAAPAAPEPTDAPAPAIDPNVLALAKALLDGQAAQVQALIAGQSEIASSMKTAMKPENQDPPLMSDFNPAGDRDHPRPALKCPFTMNGAEMPEYLLTVEELTLLNQVEPGHYRVKKTDDTTVVVSVVPTYDSATGTVTKMTLSSQFGNKRNPEQKNNWPPLRVWLAQLLGVPAPERATAQLPLGRIAAPQMGSASSLNGVITGSLASHKEWLGPIQGEVDAMLAHDAGAMAPAHG